VLKFTRMNSVLNKDYLEFSIGVFFSTAGFVFYYFTNRLVKRGHRLDSPDNPEDNSRKIIFQRLFGAFVFGVLPSVLFLIFSSRPMNEIGLTNFIPSHTLIMTLIAAIIIVPMNYFNARQPSNLNMYPQIRVRTWSPSLVIASSLGWIVYLFAYELLFRGILLFSSLDLMGFWPATILNAGIYSLVHIPKGAKESLGAIPMGILLCFLVVTTGSFWVAFFVHISLALTNEWFSLYHHPVINVRSRT